MKEKLYKFFSLIGECGFYGLIFSLPISISLIESFAGLMAFGYIGRKILKPDFRYLRFWPNVFLLFFLFFSALSIFNSGAYFNKSLQILFIKWIQYAGICLIIQDVVRDQRIFRWGIFVFLFSAFLTVLSGLNQYFYGIDFLRNRNIVYTDRGLPAITSSFGHYNGFGGYLVVVLSLLLALLLIPKVHRLKAYSLLTVTVISVVAIFFTFSRGSWVAFSVSLILVVIFSRNRFMQLIPIIFEIIYILSYPIFRERIMLIFMGVDSDRFRYWLASLKMIKDHPFFGLGVGTYMDNFSKYLPDSFVAYAHNCYLQIWAETGIFSLISFLAFVGLIIYLGFKKFFASRDFPLLGLLAGFIGYLVHSFLEVNLYSFQLAVLFWVWAGLIIARTRQPQI